MRVNACKDSRPEMAFAGAMMSGVLQRGVENTFAVTNTV
jgi:hypothetical protein